MRIGTAAVVFAIFIGAIGARDDVAAPPTSASRKATPQKSKPAASRRSQKPNDAANKEAANPPASMPQRDARTGFLDDLGRSDVDLLIKTARRIFEAAAMQRPAPPKAYQPLRFKGRTAIAHVTLRLYGKIVAEAESGQADLLDAVAAAADAAARVRPAGPGIGPEGLTEAVMNRLAIEVELIGPAAFLTAGLDDDLHFQPELYAAFEPGVDGVGVELDRRIGRCRPSVILACGYSPNLALQHAESLAGFTSKTKDEHRRSIRYFGFRTLHVWQADPFSQPIRLRRGLTLVPLEAVTAEALDAAIAKLATHVLARQKRDAWFAYEYIPSEGRYSELDSLFGQFQTAWRLGGFGRLTGRGECEKAATHLLAAAQSFAAPFEAELPVRAVVATSDVAALASTSLYLAGLSRFPSPEYTLKHSELLDAIRLVQKPEGRFENAFPPDAPTPGEAYSAGIAILAMVEYLNREPRADLDASLRSALRFYGNYFEKAPDRALATWLAAAMSAAYRRRPDPPVSDLLLRIGDWLADHQVAPEAGASPEFSGAFLEGPDTPADAVNAGCLGAMCDALEMAQRLGDAPRTKRFTEAARRAARFVMQLEFRRDECYYVGGPEAVDGAVRQSLWDHRLRADDSATALESLTRARTLLFGSPAR